MVLSELQSEVRDMSGQDELRQRQRQPGFMMDSPEISEDYKNMCRGIISVLPPDQSLVPLPRRRDYVGVVTWLQAVQNCLGEKVVFALDESWMCQEMFLGRHLQRAVWLYGSRSLLRYDGVIIVGTEISPSDVQERHGLYFTTINRTIMDAIDFEYILDMQGTLEALADYYFTHQESFDGISLPPEYIGSFNRLAKEAIEYYDS